MKIINNTDKIAIIAMLVIAIVSPTSFSLLSFISTKFGLINRDLFGDYTISLFQMIVIIALIGVYISYRQSKCVYPLFIAVGSSIFVLFNINLNSTNSSFLLYLGMLGLIVATALNHYRKKVSCTCESCKIINNKLPNI